jgi:hypothetical protein
LLLNKNNKQN